MSYSPYRWWSKGRPNKSLSNRAHLYDKIENEEYDRSYMFTELEDERKRSEQLFKKGYDSYMGTDEMGKRELGYEASRMSRVKCRKLIEEAHKDEEKILDKLFSDFSTWFGVDLESIIMDLPAMDTEELYQYLNETYPRRTAPPVPRVWDQV